VKAQRGLISIASAMIGISASTLLVSSRPQSQAEKHGEPRSTIAFVSTRHEPTMDPATSPVQTWLAAEIYLMDGDGTNAIRLTQNADFDGFPALSPNGSRIVFDSNRLRIAGEPLNTSDLFLMNADGSSQTRLTRGSSATWSSDGNMIAFHASASGKGVPIKPDPGAATTDSDIFVMNLAEFQKKGTLPRNLTNSPTAIDDDADWSPKGNQVLFTSHAVTDDPQNSATAEIYVMNAVGPGKPVRLTNNTEEERAPSWSPDGKRIVFCCRKGSPNAQGLPTFEICTMNADGTGQTRITNNAVADLTPSWSPDGREIVFHRPLGGRARFQLFVINVDGTGEKQLTNPPGLNAFPNWAGPSRK
jgi:TolB protein